MKKCLQVNKSSNMCDLRLHLKYINTDHISMDVPCAISPSVC